MVYLRFVLNVLVLFHMPFSKDDSDEDTKDKVVEVQDIAIVEEAPNIDSELELSM